MQTSKIDITALKQSGTNLVNAGKLSEARNVFRKVCALHSKDLEAHMALGIICGMLGDTTDSEKHLRTAVSINPDHPGPYYNLGIALKSKGDLQSASKCYTRAIQLDPDNVACYNNLGSIYLELREPDKAINCFRKAIKLAPGSADYHYNIGIAYRMRGLRSDACKALEHAIQLKPGYISALKDLGMVYNSQGLSSRAENCYRLILDSNPADEDAISGISNVHARRRNFDKAYSVLEPFLNKSPVRARIALAYSRVCKHTGNDAAAIKLLESTLGNADLSKDKHAQVHFLLGYFHDKKNNYHKAFKHYKKGNDLRMPADEPGDYSDIVTRIAANFSADFMHESEQSGNTSDLPVFIIGMPRSGTSLVEQILASHPEVHGGGELDTLPALLNSLPTDTRNRHPLPFLPGTRQKDILDIISSKYIDAIKALDPAAARITDKMPGNFLNLGFIELLFPGASVIHCRRNPLDTCLSCYFQDFDGHQYATDLNTLARFYNQYERLMNHWNNTLTINFHSVSYEDLVNDLESTSKNIISFCGLDWDESCLDFYKHDRQVLTASIDQVNKPIYTHSVGRWRNYEEWIGELVSTIK